MKQDFHNNKETVLLIPISHITTLFSGILTANCFQKGFAASILLTADVNF